ncbi:GGDEF domain-containing protein [Bacterioplanoides sp. SCSIO 12839]|uniref:GGDEF domain-containing protein n=1 Tax=Bacterioplanoides sp. SCSIO 12839 TaxID=2829569 RepID=UPI0021054703|nr:GGDEF domain-containing protein [Bacterioplanoides sp. SCSIO 12839]UTW48237.1 diguanylate cyclase [Bacterioplanoides sp. SCSIO 12839]
MAKGAGSDSARRWREKYLGLIEDHEKLKRSSEEDLDNYRRGLVMVSLLAEGQSSTVDTPLKALREALKPGASGMNKTMDELERAVQRFESQNSAQAEVLLGQLNDVASKLLLCPLPRPLLKRIKQVRKQASSELESWSGYTTQLQNWIQIVGEVATLEGYDEPKSKWWHRWFKPNNEEFQDDNEVTLQDDEQSDEQEPGFSHIAQEVSDTLINLLSQLVIPDRLAGSATSLQTRLGKGLNWYELVPLLEDTAEFLIDCLGSGQQEFERFLHNLDQRLQAIQVLVTDATNGQAEREKARQDLDSLVREQIADIRSVVTGSEDLGDLGSSVREHLTLIVRAMEKYQEDETKREQRLAEKLEMLQARLNEMEQEASQARQIIEEHKRRATHDGLTGLPNRDAYQQRLEEELTRKSRYGGSLTLVVADVDHFKRINDNYGHLAGDKVLQLLAKAMRKSIRDVDFIGRYGGEEFVMLMPETNAEEALAAMEKLRSKVENSPFNFRKERVPITMSFGVSEFHPLEDGETVFERADKALYQAKAEGRNRCIIG